MIQLYCSQYLNNAYRLYWISTGLCCANPEFSQLPNVLTKGDVEEERVMLCTLNWCTTGEHAYSSRLLDHITGGRTELPNSPNLRS